MDPDIFVNISVLCGVMQHGRSAQPPLLESVVTVARSFTKYVDAE